MNDTTAFLFALLAFAAGFFVRPFGALVFGRLGDLVGRKYTFLITIVIMGALDGARRLLPSYETIGVAAPIILIVLRLLQGLALGGEYGGAATYVAEHAPDGKRGLYTSWIQTTATLGLFLSLLVILACRSSMAREQFEAWGWRIPFLLSIVLLVISVYIRLQLQESPVFQEIKAEGKLSKAPLTESFGQWSNLKIVLLALVRRHGRPGRRVVRRPVLRVVLPREDPAGRSDERATSSMAAALLIATPFFVVFGALSDRIGRKKIVLAGCLLAVLTYFPIFKGSRTSRIRRSMRRCRLRRSRWSRIRRSAASSSIRSARSNSRPAATSPRARSRAWACRTRMKPRRGSAAQVRVGEDRQRRSSRSRDLAGTLTAADTRRRRTRSPRRSRTRSRKRAIPRRPT